MRAGLIDQITTPASRNALEPGVAWCADNGIYSNAYAGDRQYLRWLVSLQEPDRCVFAVAPDVVADHDATLERSWPMLRPIRELGIPVAICAQNGAAADDMPWDYIDAVFLAGIVECTRCQFVPRVEDLPMRDCPVGHRMTEWKLGRAAWSVAVEAKLRGKWLHMGRVNSGRRFEHARIFGCDSVDGTFLAHGPDINLERMRKWIIKAETQPTLFEGVSDDA